MGIVIRQSFKASIVSYIGIAIGVVNTLFVSTRYLSEEQIGLQRVFLDTGIWFAAFTHLGTPFIADRFFAHFRNEEERNRGFLTFLLLIPILGVLLLTLAFLFLKSPISAFFEQKSPQLLSYYYLTIPLVAAIVYNLVLEAYSRNNARITVPSMVREVYLRLANMLLILAYGLGYIPFEWCMYGLVLLYSIGALILLFYIKHLGKLYVVKMDFSYLNKQVLKQMLGYGGLIVLGGLGTNLILTIDKVMLSGKEGLAAAGVFTIASYLAGIIEIPRKTVAQIASPIIADAMHHNDMPKVRKVYQQSATNQLILGVLLLLLIWCNIDEIFGLLPKGNSFREGKYVVLMLAFAKLLEMASGLNDAVILYSKYYKYATYLVIFMAFLTITANYLLIPIYGINGAALATLLSTALYCFLRIGLVFSKFQMQPYQPKTFLVLAIGLLLYGLISLLPATLFQAFLPQKVALFAQMVVKSGLIVLVFLGMMLQINASPELNGLVEKIRKGKFKI